MGFWRSLAAAFVAGLNRASGVEKRRAEHEAMYQASVDCLATMMRSDATKKSLKRTLRKAAHTAQRERFRRSYSRSVH